MSNDPSKPSRSAVRQLYEERDERALRLRESGMRYGDIATAIGVTRGAAHGAVTRALARTPVVDHDAYRAVELSRMDTLLSRVWPRALGTLPTDTDPGTPPDWDAVNAVLRISAHRMRLLGLNREPMLDWELEIRKAAKEAGEDPDEAVKEAMALLRGFEGRKGRGGLTLVSG